MGDCVKTKRFLMQNFLLRHRFAVTFFAGICIGTGYANIAYRYQAALPEIYNQHYLSAYADITMKYYPVSFQGFTADRHDGADSIQKIFDCILYCVSGNLCRNAGFNIGDVLRTGRNRTVSGVGCAAVYSVWNSAVFFVPNVLCSSSDRKKCTYDCGNCCDSGRGRNVYGSVL